MAHARLDRSDRAGLRGRRPHRHLLRFLSRAQSGAARSYRRRALRTRTAGRATTLPAALLVGGTSQIPCRDASYSRNPPCSFTGSGGSTTAGVVITRVSDVVSIGWPFG